jgi:hypothetical protein
VGDERNAYRILVGDPIGKLPIERLRRRWRVELTWILGRYVVRIAGGWN